METLWNEDRIGRLEALYRDGYSFTLIAAEIGMSRNATIGKARRLELPQQINITKCKPREAPFVTPKRDRFGAVAMIPEPEPISRAGLSLHYPRARGLIVPLSAVAELSRRALVLRPSHRPAVRGPAVL